MCSVRRAAAAGWPSRRSRPCKKSCTAWLALEESIPVCIELEKMKQTVPKMATVKITCKTE